MAYEVPGFVFTAKWEGGSDTTADDLDRFMAVIVTSNGLDFPGSTGDRIDGVVQMKCEENRAEVVRVMRSGITKGIAHGTINAGSAVKARDDGKFEETSTQADMVGKALEGAGADGEAAILLY